MDNKIYNDIPPVMSDEETRIDGDAFELRLYFGQMTKLLEEMRDMREVMAQANIKGHTDIVLDHVERTLMRIERVNTIVKASKTVLEQMKSYIRNEAK